MTDIHALADRLAQIAVNVRHAQAGEVSMLIDELHELADDIPLAWVEQQARKRGNDVTVIVEHRSVGGCLP